jgi:hypothetical protein
MVTAIQALLVVLKPVNQIYSSENEDHTGTKVEDE